jgi:3-hydroxyisobutyrate dehydrogenase
MDKPIVAFVGLGIMGLPMAQNLVKAGFKLRAFNRTPGKARVLVDAGAVECPSPRAAAEGADIVITMVTDTPDVEAVLFGKDGVVEGARPGTLVIDMSTISPDATRAFATRLNERKLELLDAPVSGGDVGARSATLTIMVGGSDVNFERALPVLQALGKRVTLIGPSGSGQATKACNQILCTVTMVAACEALRLAQSQGLDLEKMLHAVTGGAGNSWTLENLAPRILKGDMNPGFMVRLLLKDLAIVDDTARKSNLPLPGTALGVHLLRAVKAMGGDNWGTQAMILAYERMAGQASSDQAGRR